MPDTIVITREEYDSLLEDSEKLAALEAQGVDNWDGYDEAMKSLRDNEEQ